MINIKPHDISEDLNLVKNNSIWFRKFIYSKNNFQFELIHIPKFHFVCKIPLIARALGQARARR